MAFQRPGTTNTAAPAATRTTQTAARDTSQKMTVAQDTSVTYTANGHEVSLSFQDIRNFICPDVKVSDAECRLFLETCKCNGFDPFLRDAYLIKYDEKKPASIVVASTPLPSVPKHTLCLTATKPVW